MIKLRNKEIELQLLIEGYAYPFSREYWDANWLSIKISIINNLDEIEQKNDPALLTTELLDLKEWFQSIKIDQENSSSINFLEPCIAFSFENNVLSVFLKYGLNPNNDQNLDSIYVGTFNLNQKEINNIISYLEKETVKFPEKTYSK